MLRLAALIALALCALLLLTSRRTPFQAFVIGTNKVRGDQIMQVVVTNTSRSAYEIQPVMEVMANRKWVQSSVQFFEFDMREMRISKETLLR
jgi:hypothetical protein